MLGFARNIMFFRVDGGCGRRRFAVESVSNCARSGTEGSRRLILFFAAAVLLCFACVETLCVHWNWCTKAMCSRVACCKSIALSNSVCADKWNGCIRVSRKVHDLQ